MDQAVELPLRAHLGLAPEREPVHALVVPDAGENRLHGGDAPAVQAAALRRINGLAHALARIGRIPVPYLLAPE